MTRLFLIALLALVLGFAASGKLEAASGQPTSKDPVSMIDQDFRNGKLSLDERAIYTARAIRNPSTLPTVYQSALGSPQRFTTRDITVPLRDIRVTWNQLADSTQRIVSNILTRWNTAFSYVSPSGFFRLHYDTTGSNAVPSADNDSDGIPDYVEKCAAYADSSLAKQLSLGYVPPPSDGTAGGDSLYDIYFEEMPYYGYTQPENPGPQPWDDYTSYLVLHRNFIGFPPNLDPEGIQAGAAKVTCAHEFHHAIQFAYNVNQPGWYMEEDATAMETLVYPKVNDNYNYLPSFFSSPQTSLMDQSIHEYACFIWGLFLAQKFDTSLMLAAWQGGRFNDIFQTVADTLTGRYGWTEDSAMAEFAVWNFCTRSRNDGLHFRDAANYPLITIGRTHSTYPVVTQAGPSNPSGYGSCYIQFQPGSYTGKLRLTFHGDPSRHWAAYVILSTASNVHQFQKLSLDPVTLSGTVDILGFENYVAVTLVGINTSPNSAGAAFTYSAQVLAPYSMRDTLIPDSAVYSGATRVYTYKMWNSSPINETVKLVHWDQRGWMVRDSTSQFLLPGDSATVAVSVHPPVGTPLGTSSQMYFRTVSLNDTTVTVERVSQGTVFLQRGDVNFDGLVNLGDLSYLVAYLTGLGNAPIPVSQAGDFNCVGIVDLADLTALVSYLTGSGSKPPCNPF